MKLFVLGQHEAMTVLSLEYFWHTNSFKHWKCGDTRNPNWGKPQQRYIPTLHNMHGRQESGCVLALYLAMFLSLSALCVRERNKQRKLGNPEVGKLWRDVVVHLDKVYRGLFERVCNRVL